MLFLEIVLAVFFLLALFDIVDSQRRQADALTIMAQMYQLGTFASISDFDFSAAVKEFEEKMKVADSA